MIEKSPTSRLYEAGKGKAVSEMAYLKRITCYLQEEWFFHSLLQHPAHTLNKADVLSVLEEGE